MTEQKYLSICKYANKIYYSDNARIGCAGDTYEDYRQKLLLCALEYPDKSNAWLYRHIYLDSLEMSEDVPYNIVNMKMFSDILQDADNVEYIENTYLGTEQNFDGEEKYCWLYELAKKIFKSEEMQDCFLNYMFGATGDSKRQNKVRQTLYRHRLDILDFLFENEKLTIEEYDYYKIKAESMTKQATVYRKYSDSYYAKRLRKNYDPQKAHERYLRKKAKT